MLHNESETDSYTHKFDSLLFSWKFLAKEKFYFILDSKTFLRKNQIKMNVSQAVMNSSVASQLNGTALNGSGVVYYAQTNRFLANQTDGGRMVQISPTSTGGSLAVPILVVLGILIAMLAGGMGAAFFVRKRFTTWRLNGSKSMQEGGDDGAKGALTSPSENGSTNGDIKPDITEPVTVNIDTPITATSEATETVNGTEAAEKCQANNKTEAAVEQQVSPTSASPLINEDEASNLVPVESTEPAQPTDAVCKQPEQITSSSSLIVSVLNELSESVVCKLANKAPDSESQPLSNE